MTPHEWGDDERQNYEPEEKPRGPYRKTGKLLPGWLAAGWHHIKSGREAATAAPGTYVGLPGSIAYRDPYPEESE